MKFLTNPLVWFLLAVSLFFVGMGAIGFIGPDEPRYADVARGMLESGDYITPRLFGKPWFEKPPLYYWLAAVSFRLGVNELDARLPSALAALGLIGLWFPFARGIFRTRAAALSCIVLAGTLGWIGFAHAAVMDMLFSALLDASLAFLALWFWKKEETHLYLFYTLLALATLAKGPAAIVLAGLVALAYLLTFREWKTLWQTITSPGVILFFVVALPWYVLCYQRNGYAFISEFILKHNFGRYVSTALGHPQPAWYYFPVLAAGFFPWTPLLLLPILDVILSGPRAVFANRQKTYLFYWIVVVFVFFSFSQNKLPGYILPVLPPLALWIGLLVEGEREMEPEPPKERKLGRAASRQKEIGGRTEESENINQELADDAGASRIQRAAVWLIGASAVLILTVPFLASLLGDSFNLGLRHALASSNLAHMWSVVWKGPIPRQSSAFLIVPVGLAIYMLWRRNILEAAFLVLIGVALCVLGLVGYLSPEINRVASARSVAVRLQTLGVQGSDLATYHIHRVQALGLSFYMDNELPEWDPKTSPASIAYIIADDTERLPEARSYAFFPGQHLRLWTLPPSEIVIQVEPPKQKDQAPPDKKP